MHLREGEFSSAHTDFFEAFKNYDESGSPRLVMVTVSSSSLCQLVIFIGGPSIISKSV